MLVKKFILINSSTPNPSLNLNFAATPAIPAGLTATRSTTGTCMAYAATAVAGDLPLVTACAINESRFTNARRVSQGVWSAVLNDGSAIPLPITLLAEEARTNLLLNAATPATQNVTVTAQAYTVSMWGTGTCTLSGTGSGTLTGTSATTRVSLTFTPTAGTLTLTFAGTNTNGQLEAGVTMSSFIPAVGTALTRTVDALSFTGAGLSWYNPQQGTFVIKASGQYSSAPGNIGVWNPLLTGEGSYAITYNKAQDNNAYLYLPNAQAGVNPVEYQDIPTPTTILLGEQGILNISRWTYYPKAFKANKVMNLVSGTLTTANDNKYPYYQAGKAGFGIGIYPTSLPSGFSEMSGTTNKYSANYGNYTYSDGSVMCWVPRFYYRIGSAASPNYAVYGANALDIAGIDTYADEATANAAGFALHRAFYNNGVVKAGFFVDKYMCSNNAGKASSIALGNPLSSAVDHNPFSGLTGTPAPANTYGGAFAAVKTRGASFFPMSIFIHGALAMLSVAHGQAATASTYCAWYNAGRTTNFPKGNNNNLKDINEAGLTFTSTGHATYLNCAKTGSASNLAKTAHNGQTNGVVDLNGNMWEVTSGFVASSSFYYMLKTSCDIGTLNGGNTLSTDAWGATSYAANYDNMSAAFGVLECNSTAKLFGNSTNQVFDAALSGDAWKATSAGVPKAGGAAVGAGTAMMGMDLLYDYPKPNEMCTIVGGTWYLGSGAGVWTLSLSGSRTDSYFSVGVRAALYL